MVSALAGSASWRELTQANPDQAGTMLRQLAVPTFASLCVLGGSVVPVTEGGLAELTMPTSAHPITVRATRVRMKVGAADVVAESGDTYVLRALWHHVVGVLASKTRSIACAGTWCHSIDSQASWAWRCRR